MRSWWRMGKTISITLREIYDFLILIPKVFFFFWMWVPATLELITARVESDSKLDNPGSSPSAFRLIVSEVALPGSVTFENTARTIFSSSSSSQRVRTSSSVSTSSFPSVANKSTDCASLSFLAFRARISWRASSLSISRLESIVRFSSAFIGLFSSSSSFASRSSSSTAFSSLHGSKFRDAPCSAA